MPTDAATVDDLGQPGPPLAAGSRGKTRMRVGVRVRTVVLQLHRWIGLTVGLILVFMAITGILVSYRPYLEPVVNRDLLTVPTCTERVPLDALTENARAAHPGGELDYVRLTPGAEGAARMPAAQIRIADPEEYQHDVFLNPCTGAVLGWRARYDGWLATLEEMHRFRFMDGGNLVVGTTALLFAIVLIGGGLYMWWPRSREFRKAARLDPALQGRARTLNRHKVIGLYASGIVLASALTGLPLSFDWFRDGVYALGGSKPVKNPVVKVPEGAKPASMETYWKQVQALVPNYGETLIHYPYVRQPKKSIDVFTVEKGAPNAFARTMIYLDPFTGNVVRFTPYEKSSAGQKLYFWMLSWHMGMIGPKWLSLFLPLVLILGAASVPVLAYTGASSYLRRTFRKTPGSARIKVQVIAKRVEADGICTFELARLLGSRLPQFSAGSHVDVYVRDGLVRQYSLCNDPSETDRYLIAVLRVADSRGGSIAMHDDVQEGDVIEISEPKNHFPLANGAKRSLLVAGGIGVTPLLCMAERLANAVSEFELHYCTRSPERTAFLARIRESSFADRVKFHFSDGPPEQKFDLEAIIRAQTTRTHLYVCGPQGFMDAVLGCAQRHGWAQERLHREYFSSNVMASPDDTEFDVRIASTGKLYRIERDQTVVAALARHGIQIPTSCEQGACGTCLTRVLDGAPDHRDVYQTDEERRRNDQFTPCCSRAKTPVLVLDL